MILFVTGSAPRDVKALPYNSSAVKLTWEDPTPKQGNKKVSFSIVPDETL